MYGEYETINTFNDSADGAKSHFNEDTRIFLRVTLHRSMIIDSFYCAISELCSFSFLQKVK